MRLVPDLAGNLFPSWSGTRKWCSRKLTTCKIEISMIRVLICDDQDVVREGLRAILGTPPNIQVVGVAEDGAQAVEMVQAQQPAVVLMGLNMPGVNGILATRAIRDRFPSVRVLALTTYDAYAWG